MKQWKSQYHPPTIHQRGFVSPLISALLSVVWCRFKFQFRTDYQRRVVSRLRGTRQKLLGRGLYRPSKETCYADVKAPERALEDLWWIQRGFTKFLACLFRDMVVCRMDLITKLYRKCVKKGEGKSIARQSCRLNN